MAEHMFSVQLKAQTSDITIIYTHRYTLLQKGKSHIFLLLHNVLDDGVKSRPLVQIFTLFMHYALFQRKIDPLFFLLDAVLPFCRFWTFSPNRAFFNHQIIEKKKTILFFNKSQIQWKKTSHIKLYLFIYLFMNMFLAVLFNFNFFQRHKNTKI